MTRRGTSYLVALVVAGTGLVGLSPSVAAPTPGGELTLNPCDVVRRALCGSIQREWEPGNPAAGTVKVGFAFVRARTQPALGTLIPHEGGPGYSTTGTGADYAAMYGSLLDRYDMLLVDQRGTGLSQPVRCPDLQRLVLPYKVAVGRCGRSLGERADDYTTPLSADDLADVIERLGLGPVSLYGDSYGTFFVQVFAGRHPELVRSVVVDGAYPTYGESTWYPTQTRTMRRAFDVTCRRSPACRNGGRDFLPALRAVLREVREKPWKGRAYDADGRRARIAIDGSTLTSVVFAAAYTPAFYRELTAALRSALRGYRAPLLRLVAEAIGGSNNAGPAAAYSEGLYAAVACHDYPQPIDMTAPPGAARERQLEAAIRSRARTNPRTYAPFTVREYASSDWQALDMCTRWPTPAANNPPGPVVPPNGYPDLPVLVLSGELDSLTTPLEGEIVANQFPDAKHIVVRNSVHVTAVGDRDKCAERIVRAFTRSPGSEDAVAGCARDVEPVRAMGHFPRSLASVGAARGVALTVADVMDRWWSNESGSGVGLHGGTWSYTGYSVVRLRLEHVRLLKGLAVSGQVVWDRDREQIKVNLTLAGTVRGSLRGGWDTRAVGAKAALSGRVDGRRVRSAFGAP